MSESLPSWRILRFEEVGSTNDIASRQEGWTAVLARRQTKGRGRYRRSWVSDEGGIWLSAVVPTPGPAEGWSILPLAAGWALRGSLEALGVRNLRLRWPNDLMIGSAKLAGILVERFNPQTAVLGIGINYDNAPDAIQRELAGLVTRLADHLNPLPPRDEVLGSLLAHIAAAQQHISSKEAAAFLPSLNRAWQIDRVMVLLQNGKREIHGSFLGVDEKGRLLLRCDDASMLALPPNEVDLLRELPI